MSKPFTEDLSPTIRQPEQSPTPRQPSTGPGALAPETVPCPDATPHLAAVSPWPALEGYEVVGELGGGGMGVVYRARQLALNRLVAVKMLRGDHRTDEERARFQIEAEAVARLQHPNIVQIFQLGEQDDRPFFAMELVEGGTLAQYTAGKPLSNREAAQLVEVLARAMHHAHERGVIHRDLKPSNVLLQKNTTTDNTDATDGKKKPSSSSVLSVLSVVDFVPKISDFGLAKHLHRRSDVTLQSGAVLGTPSYMAPEQASGMASEAGPLCDIYGLGAILYELLTGRPPFKGATNLETLRQVQEQDPVSPSGLRPRLHRDLETICLKCLAKRPGRRYPSALALAEDLRRYLDGEPILGRREGLVSRLWRRARRNLAVTGLLLALLAAAATAWVFGIRAHREQARTELTARLERELEACDGSPDAVRAVEDLAAALAREGLQERADQARERLRQKCETCIRDALAAPRLSPADLDRVRTMLSTLEARDPALAERLQQSLAQRLSGWDVLFDLQRTFDGLGEVFDPARVQPADGALRPRKGNANRVLPVVTTRVPCEGNVQIEAEFAAGAWGAVPAVGLVLNDRQGHTAPVRAIAVAPPPAAQLTAAGGRLLASASEDGTVKLWDTRTRLCRATLAEHRAFVLSVSFSPDGTTLASTGGDGEVLLWDVAGKLRARLPKQTQAVWCVVFSPDGRTLATAGDDSTVKLWDVASGSDSGPILDGPRRVLRGHSGGVRAVCFAPRGGMLASAGFDGKVRLWDAERGTRLATLSEHVGGALCVAFSPDGTRLASGGKDNLVRLWDVAAKRELVAADGHTDVVTAVAFTPDGATLISTGEDRHIRLRDPATAAVRASLEGHGQWVSGAAVASGSLLATSGGDRTVRLWDLQAERQSAVLQPGGYTFLLAAPQPAAPAKAPVTLDEARSKHLPLQLRILRDGVLLREGSVRPAGGPQPEPLRLRARCEGERLVFQVNDLPALEFHDPFPLRPSGEGVFAVHWPEGVAVTRLRAVRQALPRQPSPLERGDEAFGQGRFAEAFDHYRAQSGAAGRPEARYKEALCLAKMQRLDEAAREFEQVAASAESSGRWRMPALCQLWLLEVRSDHATEADAVFRSLATEFRFEELAAFVPDEVREEMLRAYHPGGTFDLLRHNPHRIRNLERARDVEGYLKAPPHRKARTRYDLLQAYLVEDRAAQARDLAEELLRNPTLTPSRRIDVLEDRVWLLLRDGQPQRALDEVNGQLLARPGESSTGQYRRVFLPLLLSRARIRAHLKQWKEAEDDLKDLFRLMPDPGHDSTPLDAWLLCGFLREQQGDAKGALEAWRQGLALARRQRSLHILAAAMLASLSGEMTNQDAEQMVAGVLGDTSDRSPVLTLFRLKLFPFEELATGLRKTWRSRRGHEYARRIAFRDIAYGEMLSVQVVLGTFEGCRAGAFGPGELPAQEDALLWKLFNDIWRTQRSGELAHEQVVKLLTAWAGSTGTFGWAGLAPKLTPEVRGPLAYVMGRRYLRLKKPADAAMYFRTAQKEAPRDSDLWRLAEKELRRLATKE